MLLWALAPWPALSQADFSKLVRPAVAGSPTPATQAGTVTLLGGCRGPRGTVTWSSPIQTHRGPRSLPGQSLACYRVRCDLGGRSQGASAAGCGDRGRVMALQGVGPRGCSVT